MRDALKQSSEAIGGNQGSSEGALRGPRHPRLRAWRRPAWPRGGASRHRARNRSGRAGSCASCAPPGYSHPLRLAAAGPDGYSHHPRVLTPSAGPHGQVASRPVTGSGGIASGAACRSGAARQSTQAGPRRARTSSWHRRRWRACGLARWERWTVPVMMPVMVMIPVPVIVMMPMLVMPMVTSLPACSPPMLGTPRGCDNRSR